MQEVTLNPPRQKVKINFVTCHRLPERSFFYKGKQFPVCARCTGFYAAYLTLPIFTFWWHPNLIWMSLMMVPALADGLTQAYMNRESNNLLRLITGIFAGAGSMALACAFGRLIGDVILNIIN